MNLFGGTTIAVFDFAAYAAGGQLPHQRIQRVSDDLILAPIEERQASASVMGNIEQSITAKVLTDQGFEIRLKNATAGQEVGITDPTKNPYLLDLWMTELTKALHHGIYHGFAAVKIRTLQESSEDPVTKLREELVNEIQNRETINSDDEDDPKNTTEFEPTPQEALIKFFRDEHRALGRQRPKAPPNPGAESTKSYRVPMTLDPLTDYFVGARKRPDGSRVFDAYFRDRKDQEVLIPDTFVFMFREPDAFCTPSSMFLDCLADLQMLRTMTDRYDLRDYNNTHPVYVYQSRERSGGTAVIPNETHISFSTTGGEEPGDTEHRYTQPNTHWVGDREVADNTLEKRKKILQLANEYMKDAVHGAIKNAGNTAAVSLEPAMPTYNPQLGHYSTQAVSNPFLPFLILPEYTELSPNIPRVVQPGDWQFVIRLLQTNIANACGIVPQTITGERAVVGADIQQNREENNARIRKLQKSMERLIGMIYVQAFSPLHKQWVDYSISESEHQTRLKLLTDAETREQLRYKLQLEYDRLTVEIEETMEERARAEVVEARTAIQMQLNRIPTFDMNSAAFPWDSQDQSGRPGSRDNEYWRILAERDLKVIVHVFENPNVSFDDLLKLFQSGSLDELEFRRLSLRAHGLPEHYISKMPLGQMLSPPGAEQKAETAGEAKKKPSKDKEKEKKSKKKKEKKKAGASEQQKAKKDSASKRQKMDSAT